MKRKGQSSYFVPALEKGLDVLEALALANVPQSLAQLARTLNRTSSELFRMIDALEKRSYIARDPVSGAYRLTLKLYELAHTHSPVDQLLSAAEAPMRELADSIRESCHLSVLSRGGLLVIAQAESPEPVRLSVEVGSRALPLNTASGCLLIAFLGAEEQSRFLENDPVYAKMAGPKRANFRAELAKMRKKEFYRAESTRRVGTDVSCIVGHPGIGVSAALGVPFIAGGPNEGKERKLIPAIRVCAKTITEVLGLTAPRRS